MFGYHYQNAVLGFMFALLVGILSYYIWIMLFPLSFVVVPAVGLVIVLIVNLVARKWDFAIGAVVGVVLLIIFAYLIILSLSSLSL